MNTVPTANGPIPQSLSNKVTESPSDIPSSRRDAESFPSGQMTRNAHEVLSDKLRSDWFVCDEASPVDWDKLLLQEKEMNEERGEKRNTEDTRREFKVYDLTCELTRRYIYEDYDLTIEAPSRLFITEHGSHRVEAVDGWVTYVPPGWRALEWRPADPDYPVMF